MEIDILPLVDHGDEAARLADLIEGVAGEWSPFEEQHGFSMSGKPQYTGWCLDKEDLCVAKLCAFREKDQNFVAALLDAGLVDANIISHRPAAVPERHLSAAERGARLDRSPDLTGADMTVALAPTVIYRRVE
jgi:hypothetical protein